MQLFLLVSLAFAAYVSAAPLPHELIIKAQEVIKRGDAELNTALSIGRADTTNFLKYELDLVKHLEREFQNLQFHVMDESTLHYYTERLNHLTEKVDKEIEKVKVIEEIEVADQKIIGTIIVKSLMVKCDAVIKKGEEQYKRAVENGDQPKANMLRYNLDQLKHYKLELNVIQHEKLSPSALHDCVERTMKLINKVNEEIAAIQTNGDVQAVVEQEILDVADEENEKLEEEVIDFEKTDEEKLGEEVIEEEEKENEKIEEEVVEEEHRENEKIEEEVIEEEQHENEKIEEEVIEEVKEDNEKIDEEIVEEEHKENEKLEENIVEHENNDLEEIKEEIIQEVKEEEEKAEEEMAENKDNEEEIVEISKKSQFKILDFIRNIIKQHQKKADEEVKEIVEEHEEKETEIVEDVIHEVQDEEKEQIEDIIEEHEIKEEEKTEEIVEEHENQEKENVVEIVKENEEESENKIEEVVEEHEEKVAENVAEIVAEHKVDEHQKLEQVIHELQLLRDHFKNKNEGHESAEDKKLENAINDLEHQIHEKEHQEQNELLQVPDHLAFLH